MPDTFERLRAALADRYAIERELGAGGMATVYLAEDVKHHRKVAVKVLRPDLAAALGPERFLREIEIAANLTHPHIVPLYDSGEADGFLFYVLPYIEGESLREKLTREGELPITDAVRILRDVVDALASAHKHGVVHRDIKPDNVLLSENHALVTDFGVAKAVSEATGRQQLTTAGVALGTPAYMAPEQAVADPHIDHRADIYAVGALAYELLTGRPPFTGTTPQMVLSAHVTEAPEPVTKDRHAVPPALAQLVMRCLEKKPADRWQSAQELLPQLEALATPSGGVTPTDMLPVAAAARAPSRRARMAVTAAVAVLGVAAAIAIFRPTSGSALVPNRVVVAVLENQTGDPSLGPVGRMAADWITQGLQKTGIVDVIPSPTAIQASQFVQTEMQSGRSRDPVRALAEETGAGIVISGAYYREGETLQFQVQVTDAHAGRLLDALDPVSGSPESPREAIERLRQRVMGFLAVSFDERLATQASTAGQPPTFEAYRAFNEGMERYIRDEYREALPHFYRAFELDSTFVVSLLFVVINHLNSNQRTQADSVLRVMATYANQLTPYHRAWLEHFQARFDGDNERALGPIRRAAEMAPGSKAVYNYGRWAGRTNRPQELVDALIGLDPERGAMRGWLGYWGVLRGGLHSLGDHARELEAARRERQLFSDRGAIALSGLGSALAALGRVDEVMSLVDEVAAMSEETVPGGRMTIWANELWSHGHPEVAREVLDIAIRWFQARPPEEAANRDNRDWLGTAMYSAGRHDEAANIYDALLRDFPDAVDLRGDRGVVAASRGDSTQARRDMEWLERLDRPYLFGSHTFNRARIAAVLGERDRAVALLREAFAQGQQFAWFWHSTYFESLRDYPPFQELMRPKG